MSGVRAGLKPSCLAAGVVSRDITSLDSQGVYNNFNPITGMACKQDGTWAPASDPWQHQALGLRPAQPSPQAAEAKANKAQRAAGIVAMRQERIATDGLCYCKRVGVASITMISVRNPLQDYFTASVWGAQ
ncbi:MAG: hypothetical protein WDW36_010234 [Sanguina aurantia]